MKQKGKANTYLRKNLSNERKQRVMGWREKDKAIAFLNIIVGQQSELGERMSPVSIQEKSMQNEGP